MADNAPGEGIPHPDAVRAREIQDAIDRVSEIVRDALAKHLNPELIEDGNWTLAKLEREKKRIFGIGE